MVTLSNLSDFFKFPTSPTNAVDDLPKLIDDTLSLTELEGKVTEIIEEILVHEGVTSDNVLIGCLLTQKGENKANLKAAILRTWRCRFKILTMTYSCSTLGELGVSWPFERLRVSNVTTNYKK
ncbi:hypothetical protein TorRG33x02_126750 [Trema orientale]|uniref:Uncharacterized protein n=1 Tax=Trema orientale TaxID=63057 RepID=A0A2P5F1G8_TREOI|nr:hypothetical protein TorRG33x02_126750 [Trema orientale]